MAGDTINVHASSWYRLAGKTPDAPASPLNDIVTALTNGLPGVSGNKYIASQLGSTVLNPSITGFLNTRNATGDTTHPNSWLNIIVLDEQLNPVITNDGNNSYFAQVGANAGASVTPYNPSRPITKNGYVYIYVSNETPNIYTYWDNLQVTHIHGPLLQEEGYYPFGLEMKGISSQAATKMQTNYRFNAGTNLESNFDVDYYETPARNYDVQIGRFTGIDAMSEQTMSLTTYQFGADNPVLLNDPSGLLLPSPDYTARENELRSQMGNWNDVDEVFAEMDDYDQEMGIGIPQMWGMMGGGFGGSGNPALSIGFDQPHLDALKNSPGIDPQTAQKILDWYLRQQNPDYISLVHETSKNAGGHGYTVGYNFAGDPTAYSLYKSDAELEDLLNSFKANPWNAGIDLSNSETEAPNENIAQGTEFVSLNATAVSSTEALTKLDNTVKIAETTEKVFSVVTKGFAILDVGNTYLKWQNGQISTTHAIIDGIADGFTFIGLPEVTAVWGIADFIIGDW